MKKYLVELDENLVQYIRYIQDDVNDGCLTTEEEYLDGYKELLSQLSNNLECVDDNLSYFTAEELNLIHGLMHNEQGWGLDVYSQEDLDNMKRINSVIESFKGGGDLNVGVKPSNQIFVWCDTDKDVSHMSNDEKAVLHKELVSRGEACSWFNSYEDFMSTIDKMNEYSDDEQGSRLNDWIDTIFPVHFSYFGDPVNEENERICVGQQLEAKASKENSDENAEKDEKVLEDSCGLDYYKTLVEKHQGRLVLVKIGDFYQSYDGGAKVLEEVLNISLSQCFSDKHPGEHVVAGFPAYCLNDKTAALVRKGYKIAVANEDKISELITPQNCSIKEFLDTLPHETPDEPEQSTDDEDETLPECISDYDPMEADGQHCFKLHSEKGEFYLTILIDKHEDQYSVRLYDDFCKLIWRDWSCECCTQNWEELFGEEIGFGKLTGRAEDLVGISSKVFNHFINA